MQKHNTLHAPFCINKQTKKPKMVYASTKCKKQQDCRLRLVAEIRRRTNWYSLAWGQWFVICLSFLPLIQWIQSFGTYNSLRGQWLANLSVRIPWVFVKSAERWSYCSPSSMNSRIPEKLLKNYLCLWPATRDAGWIGGGGARASDARGSLHLQLGLGSMQFFQSPRWFWSKRPLTLVLCNLKPSTGSLYPLNGGPKLY